MLHYEGYQVETYPTAHSFIESLKKQLPDLFLLDVRLPDGDGIEICNNLKSDIATKDIPVIMMSAHRNFDRENGGCTAQTYIAKPFDIAALISTIRQTIEKS